MSKAKDRARAEAGQPFTNQTVPEGMVKVKCVFPPCPNMTLIKSRPQQGIMQNILQISPQSNEADIPMCPKHREMLLFMMWILPNLQVVRGQTPSGIVVPGGPQFQVKPPGAPKP
jgi:hypothetical protein